jgi:hypothetical protein
MTNTASVESQADQDADQDYQPVVLPSLLVDVTPSPFDVEGDTLLPYFMRLQDRLEKRRIDKWAKFHQREAQRAERIGGTVTTVQVGGK